MPVTRSRAASLTRREDAAKEAYLNPSRPTSPMAASAYFPQDGGDACSPVQRADANSTFSGENVASIIASLQRSQTEAFKELLESVARANSTLASEPPGLSTLKRCKATFSGRPKESVEAFIDAIEAYSQCAQVSDPNILRGLSYIFKEEAATWWKGIKDTVSSWHEVKQNLWSAYGDRRPPHRIYLEIFSASQQQENTDIFVARIRALLARLPKGDVSVSAQLDITYGLLHSRIRKRLRREEFESFSDLLRLARMIEDAFDEDRKPTTNTLVTSTLTSTDSATHATTNARTRAPLTAGAPAAAGMNLPHKLVLFGLCVLMSSLKFNL